MFKGKFCHVPHFAIHHNPAVGRYIVLGYLLDGKKLCLIHRLVGVVEENVSAEKPPVVPTRGAKKKAEAMGTEFIEIDLYRMTWINACSRSQ